MVEWVSVAWTWIRRSSSQAILPAAAAIAALIGATMYHSSKHDAALAELRADAAVAAQRAAEDARRAEQKKIQSLEEERANYLVALDIMGLALADSRDESERLHSAVTLERRRASQLAATAGGNSAAAETPWLVLDECRREYAQMAQYADQLTERARLAAGYARTVNAE